MAEDPHVPRADEARPSDAEDLKRLLAAAGCETSVTEDLQALTASATGDAFYALLVMVGGAGFVGLKEFFKVFGGELAKIGADELRELLKRRRLVISDGQTYVTINPDTPRSALAELAENVPEAASGDLGYDLGSQRWRDSSDRWGPPS